jgi:uncharacterized caspase-like protein
MVAGLVLVATVIGLATVVAAVKGERDDAQGEIDEAREITSVASSFADAVAGFDYRDLEGSRGQVAALATEGFEAEYDAALGTELRAGLVEGEVVITPTVQDVYIGSIGAAQATAIVEVDLTYSTAEATFDVTGNFMLVNLVRTPDGWQVEGLENVRSGVDTRVTDLLDQLDSGGAEAGPTEGTGAGPPDETTPESPPG